MPENKKAKKQKNIEATKHNIELAKEMADVSLNEEVENRILEKNEKRKDAVRAMEKELRDGKT